MIRFSALLVALAIGLLVAGVAASSLPLVYVSIAVCAVAALLLAAGVLRHWSEIFGTGAKRPASPFAASRPVPSPATAGRAASRPAAASRSAAAGRPASRDQAGAVGAPGMAGFRAEAEASPAARGPAPAVAADRHRGRPARRPAAPEPEPELEPAEPVHAAPTDDLWDRVNEELESAGKRDSGRLSWPAGDFSIPSGMSLPAEPPEQETLAGPGRSAGSDLWQPAAGWQPPSTPPSNWPFGPPVEPASARPAGRDTGREADRETPEPEPAGQEAEAAERAERDDVTRSARAWDAPIRAGAAQPAVAEQDEAGDGAGPDDAGQDDSGQDDTGRGADARAEGAREDEAGPGGEDAAPMWMIRPQAGPGTESTVVSKPPAVTPPARTPEPSDAAPAEAEPAEAEPTAPKPTVPKPTGAEPTESSGGAGVSEAAEADAAAKVADAAESGSAGQPDQVGQPEKEAKPAESAAPDPAVTQVGVTQVTAPPKADAAEAGPGGGEPDKPAKPAGPVQVTVVPGVARYHRSECILIRFLGEGDLETRTKQEAVAAGLIACRACQPDELPDS